MTILHIDIETYSEVDLKRCGVYKYADHKSTEVLMIAYCFNNGRIRTVEAPWPEHLIDAFQDPDTELWAFNAQFERIMIDRHVCSLIPRTRWRCVQVLAYSFGFARGLGDVAIQMGLKEKKDKDGKNYINMFSKPQPLNRRLQRLTKHSNPGDWSDFKKYCQQDVKVSKDIFYALTDLSTLTVDWPEYHLDQLINDRGLPIDTDLVRKAIMISNRAKEETMESLKRHTELDNPNSRNQFMSWLEAQGIKTPDLQKETLERISQALAKKNGYTKIVDAIDMKLQVGKTSVSKWKSIQESAHREHVCGVFQYLGASRTGRWAARRFQPHNLPRPTISNVAQAADCTLLFGYDDMNMLYDNLLGVMSSMVRSAIAAPGTALLSVVDWSGIETRLLGWITDCGWINGIYGLKRDVYREFATRLFIIPVEQITKDQRNIAKPPVLGCGYMLGGKGLRLYAGGMGVTLTRKEAKGHVNVYRNLCYEVPEFWTTINDAFFLACREGKSSRIGRDRRVFISPERHNFIRMQLPSGRSVYYYRPRIEARIIRWEDDDGEMQEMEKDTFTFMGQTEYGWQRVGAHAGHLTENLIQAMARDVLAEGLTRVHQMGLRIVGHVHDEIIVDNPTDVVADMTRVMTAPIPWATGLQLEAEGYAEKRFRKG